MHIELRVLPQETVLLDPQNGFAPTTVTSEIRVDPLTGWTARILPLRQYVTFPRHDWSGTLELSRQRPCPFCPENVARATPRFPPDLVAEGRLRFDGAVVIPNLFPYAPYSALVIMGPDHFVPMDRLTLEFVRGGFGAAVEFLRLVAARDPARSRFAGVGWNYLPYAGGSIVHPHLQVLAAPEAPNHHRALLVASRDYFRSTGRFFYDDLLEQERARGERYIGNTGPVEWVASFAPLAAGDVTAVFRATGIHDLRPEELEAFAEGISRVARYYDGLNLPSFNAALFPGPEGAEGYRMTARLVGRYYLYPLGGSDISSLHVLQGEPWSLLPPERVARDLRSLFS